MSSLRVTQNMMFTSFNTRMNKNLSDLMESNLQGSSEKRINRPSDDPYGTSRVLSYNNASANNALYKSNTETAMAWLSTADTTLTGQGSINDVITRILTLDLQGSTGTVTSDNRQQIAYELRQDFMQLISLSNTKYKGSDSTIFSGHKTDQPAFVMGLGVTSTDPALAGQTFTGEGDSNPAIVIQATSSGPASGATYRYSADGGNTWQAATVDSPLAAPYLPGQIRINTGGAAFIMDGTANVTAVDTTDLNSQGNGSWFYLRPTAIYKGDDNDNQVVTPYGSALTGTASGVFPRDVAVRMDSVSGTNITYSYSTDDGGSWTQATATAAGANTKLPIPGGFLNLSGNPSTGEQYIVHPHRADINLDISPTDSITINLVGKDIFGGLYNNPATGKLETVAGANLFEAVGRLIGYAETGSQQGMQQALDEIKAAQKNVLTKAAVVGGRENRLIVTHDALIMQKLQIDDGLSKTEDIDVTELMTKLSQQQVAYNSVLKSSSMIMQMSLVNFL